MKCNKIGKITHYKHTYKQDKGLVSCLFMTLNHLINFGKESSCVPRASTAQGKANGQYLSRWFFALFGKKKYSWQGSC